MDGLRIPAFYDLAEAKFLFFVDGKILEAPYFKTPFHVSFDDYTALKSDVLLHATPRSLPSGL